MQVEQQQRLEAEKMSRQELEAVRLAQEEELQKAKETLTRIETEREEADRKMRVSVLIYHKRYGYLVMTLYDKSTEINSTN